MNEQNKQALLAQATPCELGRFVQLAVNHDNDRNEFHIGAAYAYIEMLANALERTAARVEELEKLIGTGGVR